MEICETQALPIPMVPRLHQSNGYIKRKLRAWRVQKWFNQVGADTALTTAWKQSTPFHHGQYRSKNGNKRNFCHTNPDGTALAPKQWLYEKEATGMESSKLYCPSRCRYRTYHCVEANYSVSWGVVQGPEWQYAKLRLYQSPWYRFCTKAMVIPKRKLRAWKVLKCIVLVGADTVLTNAWKQSTPLDGGQYRAHN